MYVCMSVLSACVCVYVCMHVSMDVYTHFVWPGKGKRWFQEMLCLIEATT